MKCRTDDQRDRLEAHVFVCTNERDSDYPCCGEAGAEQTVAAVKDWLRERELYWDPIGVSTTSCLGLCSEGGTALTIQPDNEWYSDVQPADVPALLKSHFGTD